MNEITSSKAYAGVTVDRKHDKLLNLTVYYFLLCDQTGLITSEGGGSCWEGLCSAVDVDRLKLLHIIN